MPTVSKRRLAGRASLLKARNARKKRKTEVGDSSGLEVELVENPHILPGDIDLSFITEIKSEYIEDDSLGVRFKISFLVPIASIRFLI